MRLAPGEKPWFGKWKWLPPRNHLETKSQALFFSNGIVFDDVIVCWQIFLDIPKGKPSPCARKQFHTDAADSQDSATR